MTDIKDVSFVLFAPEHNADTAAHLTTTLTSLAAQSARNMEVVLVSSQKDKKSLQNIINATDISVHWLDPEDHAPLLEKTNGQSICFLQAGCSLHVSFAEKCAWFLASRPHLVFCNTLFARPNDDLNAVPQDLSSGRAWLDQYPHGTSGLFFRRETIQHAVEEGWSLPKTGSLASLLSAIAGAGTWGATLPELLMVTTPDRDDLSDVPPPNVPATIHQPVAEHYGAYATLPTAPVLHSTDVFSDAESTDKPLRILMIISWMTTGGADKFNLDLAAMLKSRGHHVTLCTTLPSDHPWENLFKEACDEVFVLDRFLNPQDIPRFLTYLIASRGVCSVLVSGSVLGYQLLPYMRATTEGSVFLDLCHVEEPHWQNGGHPRSSIGYGDLLDLNIVSTGHLSRWMIERGAEADRIKVLYTGVAECDRSEVLERRALIRDELSVADDMPVIIFGGRICEQKRPLVLAKVLQALNKNGQHFHAWIVGDGELRADFEAALKSYGLTQHVTLFGSVDHQRWHDLLKAADVFLLPSQFEGISIALLEAMSAGVVPVVSDVGEQGEVISKQSGHLVPHSADEIDVYCKAIAQVLEDRHVKEQMGMAARDVIAQKFSKRSTIEAFETHVATAKAMATNKPRMKVPYRYGIESATITLELSRMSTAFSWLANQSQTSEKSEDLVAALGVLIKLRESRIGKFLAGNTAIRGLLRRVMKRGSGNT